MGIGSGTTVISAVESLGKSTAVKPVLSGHSKNDQKLVFKINYQLM